MTMHNSEVAPPIVVPAPKLSTVPSKHAPPAKSFTLRVAEPRDADQIAQLGSHTFSTTFGYSLSEADLAAYLEASYTPGPILKDINDPAVTIIVACNVDDEVVGFTQLRRDSSEPCIEGKSKPIELQRLYVNPACHGKGIARVLVEDSYSIARREGYETIWLGVWEENYKGHKVYERLGFVKCGTHDFVMGECVQTDWVMCRAL
jgi:ribosomal protein S18 acetylase RimI-like enzyme